MIYALVVVVVGFGVALFGIIYTIGQGAARRARERADRVIVSEGLAAVASYSVNLLGSTSIARGGVRGVGVLVVTADAVEFRLGYGSTAISIPRSSIVEVAIGKSFRIKGKIRRYRRSVVLTLRWTDADALQTTGFGTRQANEIASRLP